MSYQKFQLILSSREMISPRVLKLGFSLDQVDNFTYLPGQFLTLYLPWRDKVLRRSYSIASPPSSDGRIEIALTLVQGGRASSILDNLGVGESVEATGPFGRLILQQDNYSRYVLIATGTGVSPYRAMLPDLKAKMAENAEVVLLLGVRDPDELLFGAEFESVADATRNFSFRPCYSRHESEKKVTLRGYVQDHLDQLGLQSDKDMIYLCGNPDMIDTSVNYLKEHGFSNPSIRREKYVSSN